MDEPPYDDDDLIDDYVNHNDDDDYDGISQHDEEEYFNEQDNYYGNDLALEMPVANDETKENGPNNQGIEQIVNTEMEQVHYLDDSRTNVPREVNIREHDGQRLQTDNGDLYGFQRFNGNQPWRTVNKGKTSEQNDTNTMTATSWKQRYTDYSNNQKPTSSSVINQKKSPESLLLRFLSQHVSKNRNTQSSRNSIHENNTYDNNIDERTSHPTTSRYSLPLTYSRLPIEGQNSVPITLADGTMIYTKINNDFFNMGNRNDDSLTSSSKLSSDSKSEFGLLSLPISELFRRVDVMERRKQRQKRMKGEENNGIKDSVVEASMVSDKSPPTVTDKNVKKVNQRERLWVDKYAPSNFADLLSDEHSNREVLRCIKAWDPYVFHREAPTPSKSLYTKSYNTNELKPSSSSTKHSSKNHDDEKRSEHEDNNSKKKHDIRPDEHNRVILLSGPPGSGKTTLAHVIATHAGYRPLEVNASDERSASILTERISRSMESTTLNLKTMKSTGENEKKMNGRPNCLILDEIDGADAKSSISAIVEMIRAEIPATTTGAKQSKKPYLRRPIILICNQKFSPVLRNLLPYARQFDISPPSTNRLVSRLKSVLASENLVVLGGDSLLHQLVSETGGDIRSCIFTLQFCAARARDLASKRKEHDKHNLIDISGVLKGTLSSKECGTKDGRADITSTLSAVFRKIKVKSDVDSKIESSSDPIRDVDRVIQKVECYGDFSKTLDFIFTNILNVSFIDPTLDRCWGAHEWLSSADIYRSFKTNVSSTNTAEHFALQKYHLPSTAAAIHILCRVETKPKLIFSARSLMDVLYRIEANIGLVAKFIDGLVPSSRHGITGCCISTEFLPFCVWMLSAGRGNGALTKAVSTIDVLSKEEKEIFNRHVATLRALGLTYVKDDKNLNTDSWRLEPQIDQVAQLKVKNRTNAYFYYRAIPSSVKELLAQAALLEEIRERESKSNTDNTINNSAEGVQPKVKNTSNIETRNPIITEVKTAKVDKNFLRMGANQAKAAKTARKAALVGLKGKAERKDKLSNTGSEMYLDEVIRFRYQKGFTQAVRVPCKPSDLMFS